MHSLRSYGLDEPTYDNKAYTITSIYQRGTLKMYTSHLIEPSGSGERPEYHMHLLRNQGMNDTADNFRKGATAYRNARDWAKEQRDIAIAQANEKARAMPPSVDASFNLVSSFASEASTSRTCDGPASQTSFTSTVSTEHATSDTENPKRRHSRRERGPRKQRIRKTPHEL